jgi:hypothetical protein
MPTDPKPMTATKHQRWGTWSCQSCGGVNEFLERPELESVVSCAVCRNRFIIANIVE